MMTAKQVKDLIDSKQDDYNKLMEASLDAEEESDGLYRYRRSCLNLLREIKLLERILSF